MKKKHTNKESSRLRPQGRTKSTISILAALAAMGAAAIAMNTSSNNAPVGKEEILEAPICTVGTKAAQTTTTVTIASTTPSQTSTVVYTSISTSTATQNTDCSQTETQTPTPAVVTLLTTTPVIETMTEPAVIEPIEAEPVDAITSAYPVSDAEYVWLCNLVGHEYGSDWVPVAEKAKVVAVVINRVNSPQFPNDVWSVLTAPYQFTGFSSYGTGGYTQQVTQSVKDAVDYYFANPDEYPNWLYFDGNHYAPDGSGPYNYFYY